MATARYSRFLRTISFLITICSLSFPAYAKYGGGTGEPNSPYQIATAEDLMLLGDSPEDYDMHFILTADIDLDPNLPGRKVFDKAVISPDVNDTQFGFQGIPFMGVFDGNGHTISNFNYISISAQNIGLFGYIGFRWGIDPWRGEGEIKNLGLIDPNIDTGTGGSAGSLAGTLGKGAISNCYVKGGSIAGFDTVGGLVGINSGKITNCYSTISVSGGWYVGGFVGHNSQSSTITNCYSTGSVSGNLYVGGFVGSNFGTITNCYSTGSVSGTPTLVGGLVGNNQWGLGEVTFSFWDIQTSGQSSSSGGTGKTTDDLQTA
ncbi:MAG: GLUG motif-containing protein, partial [Planctomycetota bacterium]